MNTYATYDKLVPAFGNPGASVLAEVLGQLSEEISKGATKEDLVRSQIHNDAQFARIDKTLLELAQAQKATQLELTQLAINQTETKIELKQLTTQVAELAVNQAETKIELKQLTTQVAELAVNQTETKIELKQLTTQVAELAVSQAETKSELKQLAADQVEIKTELKQLATDQVEIKTELKQLATKVDNFSAFQARTNDRLARLDGWYMESTAWDKFPAYVGLEFRKVKVLSPADFLEILDDKLDDIEIGDFLKFDIVASAKRKGAGESLHLVCEVSCKADQYDVERAQRRAHYLVKSGIPAQGMVLCEEIDAQWIKLARNLSVRVWEQGGFLV